MKKKKLLTKLHSIYSILNLTSVMNHLKTFQRAAVVVLAMVVGFSSRLSAQTCPVSNEITITVIPEATITTVGATTICSGGNATLTATPGGGTGTCTLQWQSSTDGISWTNISGATNPTLNITALTATASYHAVYTCSGSGCDVVTSNSQTVTVNPDLSITANLTNITQCMGGNSQLSITTTGGSGGALTYTWEQSTNNSTWGAATGATNTSTYTPLAAAAGTMYYRVRVSDAVSGCDAITSATSTVVVTPDLAISATLTPITECVGGNDALTVTTSGGTGGALTYTWEQSLDNSSWAGATAATNAATYIPSAASAGTMYYRVRITDGANGCDAITATSTTVTVTPDMSITANLANITQCIGGNDQLTITVTGGSGGAKTYTWEQSTDNSTWAGATSATNAPNYTPSSAIAGVMYYRVRVTDAATGCDAITSATSTTTVTPDVSITANLANITQCIGGNDQLAITVTGGSGGTKVYTWEQSTDNSTWAGATGASSTSTTYTPSSASAGTMYYRVRVTDAATGCDAITSATSTTTITPDMSITANLANITQCIGGNDQLTITLTGGSGGAKTYTWEQSTDNSTWAGATGATNVNAYTPSSASAGIMYYRVRVTDAATGCDAITSATSTTTITPDISITANLANITQCIGGNDQLTLTVLGGSGGAKVYTWEQSTNNSTWAGATGASSTSTTYTPSSASAGTMYYRVRVTDGATGCDAITSATSTVTTTPDVSITANLANITQCIGGNDQLTITVTGGSGGTKVYTWEQSTDNSTWAGATGASSTSTTYTPSSASAGTMYYRVRVTDAATGCDAITSATSTVTITPDMSITANLTNITECVGGTNALTITLTGGSGGTKTYTWEQSTDNSTWGAATGATNAATYQPLSTTAGLTYYRVRVTDAATGCDAITSATSTVTITPDLTVSTNLVDISECIGGSTALTVATLGGSGGALTYTWEQSTDNVTFGAATGATSSTTYTPSSATAGIMYYRVSVSDAASGCQSITSTVSTVTINPDISISAQPAAVVECVSGTLPMSVTASGGVGTLTYQWEVSTDGGSTYTAVTTGGTSATYIAPSTAPGVTHYRVAISNAGNGCQSITSTATTVTVVAKPTIAIAATVSTVCVGGGVVLTATPSNGTGTCTIQWQNSTDGGATFNNIPAANGTTYTTPALNANTKYQAVYSCDGNGCCN
jgi:large repetitive protein